jgi:hypothetical protein
MSWVISWQGQGQASWPLRDTVAPITVRPGSLVPSEGTHSIKRFREAVGCLEGTVCTELVSHVPTNENLYLV